MVSRPCLSITAIALHLRFMLMITRNTLNYKKVNLDHKPTDLEHNEIHEPKLLEKIESDVVCAFVTFQYVNVHAYM